VTRPDTGTKRRLGPVLWPAGVTGLFLLHFLSFPFREHAIVTDVRHYLYFASRVAEGAVPHRDFFELKTPLATFVGAGLHRFGRGIGVEPLLAVRAGYLILAALAGAATFLMHRCLWRRGPLVSLLAVAPAFGFSLLGLMPCIGNMPKLLMALCASLAGIQLHRGRWRMAGILGALAFMDWQPGILLILALALGAAVQPSSQRSDAMRRLGEGVLLGLLPFAAYYAAHGGLFQVAAQTIGAAFARGTSAWQRRGVVADWARRFELLTTGRPDELWLLVAAGLGLLLWARHLRRPLQPLAVTVSTYHYGIVAFSLLDFQGYGDVFILLHSLAFFAGVAFVDLALMGEGLAGAVTRRRLATWTAAAVLAGMAARPWVSRRTFVLHGATGGGSITLRAQRALAQTLLPRLKDRTAVFLGPSEQLYLLNRANRGPVVYWTAATYHHYRRDPQEPPSAVLGRILQSSGSQLLVCDRGFPIQSAALVSLRPLGTETASGPYGVDLYEFAEPASH